MEEPAAPERRFPGQTAATGIAGYGDGQYGRFADVHGRGETAPFGAYGGEEGGFTFEQRAV